MRTASCYPQNQSRKAYTWGITFKANYCLNFARLQTYNYTYSTLCF